MSVLMASTSTIAISVSIARMVMTAMYNGFDSHNGLIIMTNLLLPDKLAKVSFSQKTFGLLTLAWFFTFSHADIQFAKSLSGGLAWLPTTKRMEHFSAKEFAMVALGAYDEALWYMWHLSRTWSWRPRMSSSQSSSTIWITLMSFLSTGATQAYRHQRPSD